MPECHLLIGNKLTDVTFTNDEVHAKLLNLKKITVALVPDGLHL